MITWTTILTIFALAAPLGIGVGVYEETTGQRVSWFTFTLMAFAIGSLALLITGG